MLEGLTRKKKAILRSLFEAEVSETQRYEITNIDKWMRLSLGLVIKTQLVFGTIGS